MTPSRKTILLRRTAAAMAVAFAMLWILRLFGLPGLVAVLSPVMLVFGLALLAMFSAMVAVVFIRAHRWLFPREKRQ